MADDSSKYKQFKLYHYEPNLGANIVFIVLFAATGIGHVVLLVRKRVWYFIPFVIGCIFEAIGYVGRAIAAKEAPNYTLTAYILQTILILLGPALFAASIYMILARLIRFLGAEDYALVRTNWMTKIFVAGDVLSFLGQSAGGGIMAKAKTPDDQEMGENVILGGLGIQIIFFGFFVITTIVFHVRIAKKPTPRSYAVTTPWRQHILALYVTSVLILVRSIFRMAEFALGNDGVLMQSEAYLLGLDGALMFLVTAVFLWSHPSRVLGPAYKEALASANDSVVESGRDTADSFQMMVVSAPSSSVHPDTLPEGTKLPSAAGAYDGGDPRSGMGSSRGGYTTPAGYERSRNDWSPRAHRYSSSYQRE
ncbi:RTA1 like protein-domain-containing protein [Chaetomium strumarium]|uniref:RTA1 like protein-domain-containing protein n=1 Tax=Chaetomium strumarium TaxID=1170767 RepID=A0AAJ0GPM7_9PEZI|nr:RTA1 like protein-domain-containing protein [Chaetomium strumarium]